MCHSGRRGTAPLHQTDHSQDQRIAGVLLPVLLREVFQTGERHIAKRIQGEGLVREIPIPPVLSYFKPRLPVDPEQQLGADALAALVLVERDRQRRSLIVDLPLVLHDPGPYGADNLRHQATIT